MKIEIKAKPGGMDDMNEPRMDQDEDMSGYALDESGLFGLTVS